MRSRFERIIGLTLVEILVAIVIIAIALVALSTTQIGNLQLSRRSQQASSATQAANEVLEEKIQTVLANYEGYQSCPASSPVGGSCSGQVPSVDGISVTYTIARGTGYERDGLLRIQASVTDPVEATVETYVSCMDSANPAPTIMDPDVCEYEGG